MISELLNNRNLPSLLTHTNGDPVTAASWPLRRQELLSLFERNVYGITPAAPQTVTGKVLEHKDNAYANKAAEETIELSWQTPNGLFTLPVVFVYPHAAQPSPAFVMINFRPDVPDRYLPVEEIVDHGFAVARVYYQDVTADSAEMDKLASMYPCEGDTAWGKIGMWAFACSRVLDYLLTRPEIDASRVGVTGHSRLGKTALWCGAQDERFSFVVSNDSGCSGAAITRGKVGESLERICEVFPFWFCKKYHSYAGRLSELPVEQHELIALVAPRAAYVASAVEDTWADPESEYLSACAASPAWELLGLNGFVHPDRLMQRDECFHEGQTGYHMRTGSHFFSRTDWLHQMAFREKHRV